ncbi:MAG: glycosyltransferase family 2 protein [Solirubrobacteraceae bacterium]
MSDLFAPAVHVWIDEPVAGASMTSGVARVSGWVFDEAGLLESALLVVDDGPGAHVRLGVWRPDVGEAHPSVEHASSSGFEGTVDLRAVDGGTARIALLVRLGDASWREAAAVDVDVQIVAPTRERDGARRHAAFTIVHNESVMLPLWLDYYARHFDADDLYVLDHDSTDGSTADLGGRCHVVPVHREAAFDHHWLKSTVERFQAFLLRSYDAVLFAEADEFVLADPRRYPDLDAYIVGLTRPAARCLGFNVVHQPDEPPLRFDAPLLSQRRYWHASLTYSKRLLSRIPLRWSDGFHNEYNAPDDPPDPELLLIHLHRVDHDMSLARHQAAVARDWNEADIVNGYGVQNRIVDPREFEDWFYRGADLDAPPELIPEHIRSAL